MDELTDLLNELKLGLNNNKSPPEIQKSLTHITKQLTSEGSDKKAHVQHLIKNGIVDSAAHILRSRERFSASTFALVAEILAEVAKLDEGRVVCSNAATIVPLLELLSNNDSNVVLQVCRALGNICYENDSARSFVKQNNGIDRIIQLLKNLLEKDDLPDNMRTITSGCLLNLTDTYEEIQDQALEAGILDVLLQYLLKFSNDEDVVTHCLLVLSCLADSNNGRIKILEKSVLSSLVNLIEKPLNDDILDSLLELFGNLCENDSAKQKLAEIGLCERLIKIVHRHISSGCIAVGPFNVCKTVPDLIILILTGDAAMEHLWKNGEGAVYKETLSWLKSKDDHLMIAGALAAGNFARKDSHCIQMVKDGIVGQLQNILSKHTTKEGDIRMQHAVLSALRNLAIPAENKESLVKLGIVNILLNMITVETYPVVFKLLGTLRMLMDKQESVAKTVGENLEFMQRLVTWSKVEDHPGVKGEATRLIAWVAKNSKAPSVLKNVVKVNGLQPILEMVKSSHVVMQNEALATVTLAAMFCTSDVEEAAIKSDLVNTLYQITCSDIGVTDLMQNVLSLLCTLAISAKLRPIINATSIQINLKTLKSSNDEKTKELSEKTLQLLNAK